jgi:hypothetical protein
LLPFGTTEEPYETKKKWRNETHDPTGTERRPPPQKTQQELEEPGDMRIGARLGKI